MSLYNMVSGVSSIAPYVIQELGIDPNDFGRIRDAFISNEPEFHMVVLTRCGGGNRRDYQHVFDKMAEHPLFISEEDDVFDSTYAYFRFKFPEGSELLLEVKQTIEHLKAEDKEDLAFDFLRNGNNTIQIWVEMAVKQFQGR